MRTTVIVAAVLLAAGVAGSPALAGADEAKTLVNPLSLINVLTKPVDDRQTAYDESVKREGPAPRSLLGGEVQPDGSVRYGNVTVSVVRNPCPPGTVHYEPPPLPGRRRN
jgi:hypothetical protein